MYSSPPTSMPIVSSSSPPRFCGEDDNNIGSACSTPFVSAPSSPGHNNGPSGYFFSAPSSPMHHFLLSNSTKTATATSDDSVFLSSDSGSFEFEFSSRFSPNGSGGTGSSMTSADELFVNGRIRPMKLSSHLERPHHVEEEADADLDDAHVADENAVVRGRDLKVRSVKYTHRKARSMSPMRANYNYYGATSYEWNHQLKLEESSSRKSNDQDTTIDEAKENECSNETTPSCSASSSRSSSSSGRNSKKWIFLKDLLHRSKSEGSGAASNNKERFWSAISFTSEKKTTSSPSPSPTALSPSSSRDEKGKKKAKEDSSNTNDVSKFKKAVKGNNIGKPANGVWRRKLSAHEIHYTANRAQAEEMKKRTFLPYRQGLLGCLGFSSKSYGAFSGFTKTLNPISSR